MIVADKTLIDSVLSVTPFCGSNKTATKPTKKCPILLGHGQNKIT
jgi:hypothetical protein